MLSICANMDNENIPFAVYLERSKAFHIRNHSILGSCRINLVCTVFRGTSLDIIKQYLSNKKQHCVEIVGRVRSYPTKSTGVARGSILGPLLLVYQY